MSPRLPLLCGRFFLLSPEDGMQQQPPLPPVPAAAGKLRSSRSECRRLHSARHRKCAGDGAKTQTGTRSTSGRELPESSGS